MLLVALLVPLGMSAREENWTVRVGSLYQQTMNAGVGSVNFSAPNVATCDYDDYTMAVLYEHPGTTTLTGTYPGGVSWEDTYHITVLKCIPYLRLSNGNNSATVGDEYEIPEPNVFVYKNSKDNSVSNDYNMLSYNEWLTWVNKNRRDDAGNYIFGGNFGDEVYIGDHKYASVVTRLVNPALTYTSSNPNVASVTNDGKVKALAAGTTTITVTWPGDADYESGSAEFEFTVQNPPKQEPQVSFPQFNYTVTYGEAFTAPTATVNPSSLTVTYSSENEDVATVNATTGAVTIKKSGSTYIYATTTETADYNSGSASYYLTVDKADVTMSYPQESYSITEGDAFTAPVLSITPAALASEVTYSSSNESVATVNATTGAVTVNGVGFTEITATFAGNDNYNEATAKYSLIVNEYHAKGYGITILGEEVTEVKTSGDIPEAYGTGSWTFNPDTRTLTMNEMNIADAGMIGLKGGIIETAGVNGITDYSFTIVFNGENKANNVIGGIMIHNPGAITIKGGTDDASLTLSGRSYMLNGDFTIDGIATSFTADWDCFAVENLVMQNGASMHAKSQNNGLGFVGGLTLKDDIQILTEGVEYQEATPDSEAGFYKDGVAVSEVLIGPKPEVVDEKLGVFVLGKELTTSTVNGQLGTGTYAYDPDTRTMTINNATVDTDWKTVISTSSSDLTVKVVGQNVFTGGSAIHVGNGALNVIGVGEQASLTVNNGYSAQLTADYGYENMTIDNVAITLNTDTAAVMCIDLHMMNGASLKMATDPDYREWAVYPLCKMTTLTLDEGISILTEGVEWNADRRKFLKDGEEVSEVAIGPKTEIEPIKEETTETPAETAVPGEATTSEEGVTTSLGEDDEVDTAEGSVTMHKAYTTEELDELLETVVPGSSAFNDAFKGIYFMLAAGKGYVEMDIETLGNYVMKVVSGTELIGEYVKDYKGTIRIEYNITEDTWFFAFTGETEAAPARGKKAQRRSPDSTNGLKIYSVKIVPQEVVTGISETRQQDAGYGHIYNINGQRVSSLTKGLFIIDGKKVVVK